MCWAATFACWATGVAWAAGSAAPPPMATPQSGFWIPNGPVHAMATTNGVIYLGGDFDRLELRRGSGLALDLGSLDALPTFPQVNGQILAAVSDGTGGFYLGGQFTSADGLALSNLVHVTSAGDVRAGWIPAVDGPVTVMALEGLTLYVGGSFSNINGIARSRLAALDVTDGSLLPWAPALESDAELTSLLATHDQIYVAGDFNTIGGASRNGLAALDPLTGNAVAWQPNPQGGDVLAMALLGDTLYLGGTFTSMDGTARIHLAAVDGYSGTLLPWNPAWSPAQSTSVQAMVATQERIFVGGDFAVSSGGTTLRGLATLDPASGSLLPWNANLDTATVPPRPVVTDLALDATRLWVGGTFATVAGVSRNGFVALDPTTALPASWTVQWSGEVTTLAISFQTVFAGGLTLAEAPLPRAHLAALDAHTGQPLSWTIGTDGPVHALALAHDRLYVGGSYASIGGVALPNLAAIELAGVIAVNPGWDPAPDGAVRALAPAGAAIYLGGDFANVAGASRTHLAAFGSLGGLLAWNPFADGNVSALIANGTTLYAGGEFLTVAARARRHLAAIDTSGAVLPWDPSFDQPVRALLFTQSILYVGGEFTDVDGVSRNGLASFDPAAGSIRPWNPNVAGTVLALSCRDTNLVAGGNFTTVGSAPHANVALIPLTNDSPAAWDPGLNGTVQSILGTAPNLMVGGSFSHAASQPQPHLAAFGNEGAPELLLQPADDFLFPGDTLQLRVVATGTGGLGYQWYFQDMLLAGAIGPDLIIEELDIDQLGDYHAVVTNALGSVHSRTASVQLRLPAAVTRHPASTTTSSGTDVLLSVDVDGSPPPRLQWRRNSVAIPGAIGPELALPSVEPADAGLYSVTVINPFGLQESLPAEVAVVGPSYPFADAQSNLVVSTASMGIVRGDNLRAGLDAGEPNHDGIPGGASVWMGWQAKESGIVTIHTRGSTFDTLLAVYTNSPARLPLRVASDDDAGGYRSSQVRFNAVAGHEYDIAVDGYDGETGHFTLGWTLDTSSPPLPDILAEPYTRVVEAGAPATFDVLVDQSALYTFQWYRGDRRLPGATSSTLTLAQVGPFDTALYSVEVAAPGGGRSPWRSKGAPLQIGPVPHLPFRDKHGTGSFCPFPLFPPLPVGSLGNTAFGLGGLGPSITFGANTYASLTFNNENSETQPLDPNACQVALYSTDFQCIQATSPGVFLIDTKGSTVPTVLTAVQGIPLVNDPLDCQITNAPNGFDAIVTFTPVQNQVYTMLVDGLNGAEGHLTMNINLCGPPVLMATPSQNFQPVESVPEGVVFRVLLGNPECGGSFQWKLNGMPVTGANGMTWTNTTPLMPGAEVSVTASNVAGSTTLILARWVQLHIEAAPLPAEAPFRLRAHPVLPQPLVIRRSDAFQNWIPFHTNLPGMELLLPLDTSNALHQFYRVQP